MLVCRFHCKKALLALCWIIPSIGCEPEREQETLSAHLVADSRQLKPQIIESKNPRRPSETETREPAPGVKSANAYKHEMISGDAALYSRDFDKALKHYFAALDLRPNHMAPALRALRCLRLHGRAEARDNVTRIVRRKIERLARNPKTAGAAYLLAARLAIALGQSGEAIDKASVAVHKLPNLGVAWRIMGEAAMVAEQWPRAVRALQKAADLGLKAAPGTWERLADALDESGELDRAEKAARKAIELTGRDKNALRRRLNLLAAIEKHRGHLSKAEKTLKHALTLGASDAAVIHNYGALAESQSKVKMAIKHYKHALALTPSPETQWRLARALLKLERPSAALEALLAAAGSMDRWTWPDSTRWWVSFDLGKLYAKAKLWKQALAWFNDALGEARTVESIRKIRGWVTILHSRSPAHKP